MTQIIEAWHFSGTNKLCRYDNREIVIGQTLTIDPPLEICQRGLHASKRVLDAVKYAPGPYVWRVQLSGYIEQGDDKLVAQHRTALWGYDATEVLRRFSRAVAMQAIEKYWDAEKFGAFPEIALQWLRSGDESLRSAAESAACSAAWSAAESAAESAAWSAACSAARSAAESAAWSAAESAAWSAARSAAWSAAESAARSAARSAAWSAARSAARSAACSDQNTLLEKMILDGRP